MTERQRFANIDDYLASVSPDVKLILEEIRRLIRVKVPNAEETISYQLPAFKLSRTFIYFAAFKKHIGIYPPVKGNKVLADALLPYRGEKGNLKFLLDQPMPYELIGRVAVALAKQYNRRAMEGRRPRRGARDSRPLDGRRRVIERRHARAIATCSA